MLVTVSQKPLLLKKGLFLLSCCHSTSLAWTSDPLSQGTHLS